jgi:hypothetical protein
MAARELAAAIVMETPAAARRHGVRIDTLRDEPLLAAIPESSRYAGGPAIPLGAFLAEVVLLLREPTGRVFNAWFRAVIRAGGFELERTLETLSARLGIGVCCRLRMERRSVRSSGSGLERRPPEWSSRSIRR